MPVKYQPRFRLTQTHCFVAKMEDPLYELFKTLDSGWEQPRRWFKANGKPSDFFANSGKIYSRNEDGSVKIQTFEEFKQV